MNISSSKIKLWSETLAYTHCFPTHKTLTGYILKRKSMNFIEMFLDYTQDAESPTSFFKWAAIGTLAAVMRDNVWIDQGLIKVYPNVYVILVADSGGCRKGLPLKVARKFIEKIGNTKFIAGRASIQGVLHALASTETSKETKVMLKGASGMLYSEELSAFLVDDPAAIKVLTDWYDFHARWSNTLVGTGVTELNNVCVSLLSASNETLLKDVYTQQALYGGLLARTFLIVEHRRRKKNSLMFVDRTGYEEKEKRITEHLKRLSRIKGPIYLSEDAAKYYDEWYNGFEDENYKSKTGFIERIHTGVLKLALCLAAAEPLDDNALTLRITLGHIEEAIGTCWALKRNYESLTMSSGKSPIVQQIAFFIKELSEAKGFQLTRKEIIKRLFTELDAQTLENVVATLTGGGIIKECSILGETGYQLTDKTIREIMKVKGVEVGV